MCIFIEENIMSSLDSVINILNQTNASFDNLEAKLNILSINYELFRYELYNFNDKLDVNDLIEELYSRIYYNLNITYNIHYDKIINEVVNKSKEIYNAKKLLAPKEIFTYRLLLEQLNIKENCVSKKLIQELLFGKTLIGTHLDDIEFYLDDNKVKDWASEGQLKNIVISYFQIVDQNILFLKQHLIKF